MSWNLSSSCTTSAFTVRFDFRAPFAKYTADAVSFKARTSPPLTSTVFSSRGQPVVDTTPQTPRSSNRPTSAATPNTHEKSATFTSAATVWFDTAAALAGLLARSCLILCAACLLSPGPLPVLGIATGTSVKRKREALVCVLLLASVAGAASTSTSTTATPSPASSPQPVCVTTGSSEPVCRCDCSCDDPPPCPTSPTSPLTPASPTSPTPDDLSTEPAASPTSEVSPRPKCRLCLVPTVRLVRKGHWGICCGTRGNTRTPGSF